MDQLQQRISELGAENKKLREQFLQASEDIKKLKRENLQLTKEKNYLQILDDNFPNGVIFRFKPGKNTFGRFIYAGKSWESITNVSAEDASADGMSVISKIHPEDSPRFIRIIEESTLSFKSFDYELRYFYDGENLRWFQVAMQAYRDGDQVLLNGFVMDITDKKQAGFELTRQKERMIALSDNLPNGCLFSFEMNLSTRKIQITHLSKNWEHITNISAEDSIRDANNVFSKIHHEDLPIMLDAINTGFVSLENYSLEVRCFFSENNMRWIYMASHPRVENGTGKSDAFILDITKRKHAEQELFSEKSRLQALGDNFPNGALFRFETDMQLKEMKLSYLGGTWVETLNVSSEDSMNDIYAVLSKIHPDDLKKTLSGIAESADNLDDFNIEVRYFYTEDDMRWMQISSRSHIENGKIVSDGFVLDISDRKRISQALIKERDRLQALGDNLPQGILYRCEFDKASQDMQFTYLSKRWQEIANMSADLAMSDFQSVIGRVHPEDREYLLQNVRESMSQLTNLDVEIRYLRTPKQLIWVHISAYPCDMDTHVVSDGFILDISDRKNTELALLSEKERIQALGDNLPDGCLYCLESDMEQKNIRLTYLSKKWETFMGVSVQEALDDMEPVLSRIYPDDKDYLLAKISESLTTLSFFNVEIRYFNRDEEIRWMHVSSHPRKENGVIVCDGLMQDITDRKNTEIEMENYRFEMEKLVKERTEELEISVEELGAANEELYATNEEFAAINEELQLKNDQLNGEIIARQKVMKQLEESEGKLRNFVQHSFEGIIITDTNGTVVEWNHAQEKITGLSAQQAVGFCYWDLLLPFCKEKDQTEEMYDKLQRKYGSYFKGGYQQDPMLQESALYFKDGSVKYILFSIFPIGFTNDCLFGSIVRDITDQKLTDIELEQYRTQLKEMVEIKTRELTISQERIISLSNNLPGGVICQIVNEGAIDRFTYISASFTEMFQIDIDDVCVDINRFRKIIHPDDRHLFAFSDPDKIVDIQFRVITPSNETLWIQVRATSSSIDGGKYIWDGFMINITERKKIEQELAELTKRQDILIQVLQIVQSAEDYSEAIDRVLGEIGAYVDVSRTYIFEKTSDGKRINNTSEWCNKDIEPVISFLQDIDITTIGPWFDIIESEGYIYAPDIKNLHPDIYNILYSQGIKSILVIPLKNNEEIYGFVGFDECLTYKEWDQDDIQLLISVSHIISTSNRRYRAEQSIKLSQQTIRTVLDNVDASIYVVDFETSRILFANKKIKTEIGEDLEGRLCWEMIQGRSERCEFCPEPRLLDRKKRPAGPYRWECLNGPTKRWYECTDTAIEWVDGRLVHMEYAIDITERRKSREALRQSEELYRQLTVASPDAIVMCAPDRSIQYLSPKAKELFRIAPEKELQSITLIDYVHPHDLQQAYEIFENFKSGDMSYISQVLLKREDDSEFFGEVSAASVKNTSGETTNILMVIRDITERKKTETELIQAKEKAEESDNLKSAFLANMSHEIRTPINGIIGFLNFLADDNLSSMRRQEYANIVNNSSVQLVKLIDDIIDVAKIEAKQMSIQPVPFKLNEFMYELHIFFETYLLSNHKDKTVLIIDDSMFIKDCVLFIDPMRLRQVLSNLIGNAIKFTDKGFIRFGYRQVNTDKLEFFVEDTGTGLAENQKEIIFERFRQAESTNSRRHGGTGLGLTISKNLVQMMGGNIQVQSQLNEGSTFCFTVSYIPVGKQDEKILEERGFSPEMAPDTDSGKKVVLLAESDMMKRIYYKKLLSDEKTSVLCADDLRQWAGHISHSKHIDMVIANYSLLKTGEEQYVKPVNSTRIGLPLVLIVLKEDPDYQKLKNNRRYAAIIEEPVDYQSLSRLVNTYISS
jgi:PAS domain S-box-containing protein